MSRGAGGGAPAGGGGPPAPARGGAPAPAVAFVGRHNSGKTTFLAGVLPILVARGLRVGYLKHAHVGFEVDHPGKDSYRIRRTGVLQTIVAGGGQIAVIDDAEGDAALGRIVERYVRDDLDLLVIEGWKREPMPKLEVARAALSRELTCADDVDLIGVVADFRSAREVPHFSLDDHAGVAELLLARARR